MNETNVTANLPRLDVEIVHRDDPERHMEVMTIEMRASPSFRAVGGYLADSPLCRVALMFAMPWAMWAGTVEAMWRPWLALAAPQRPADEE